MIKNTQTNTEKHIEEPLKVVSTVLTCTVSVFYTLQYD